MNDTNQEKVYPGVNSQVILNHYSDEEKKIIQKLSGEWYITNGGGEINLGPKSKYKYLLFKPTDSYKELFNIEFEIIVIFSEYSSFETRTLDAIDYAAKKYPQLRIERLCSVIISKDVDIVIKIEQLVKNDQESQIIIPFSYSELLANNDSFLVRNRFKSHFYTRDLFAFEAPLKKDLYFFGRNDLVYKIVNRHRSNENSALFGLRKTGKTSVIFGVKRVLESLGQKFVFLDCQTPAFHKRSWNSALYYLALELKNQHNLQFQLNDENEFTETNAPILFEQYLLKAYKSFGLKNILIVFDEIENITFGTSPTKHWTEGLDFIYFWQTLRSIFQKHTNLFSYLIVGTNPKCIETSLINGKDNPIFNQVYFEYIPNFDVPQTREMTRKLGRIMGLQFDETVYAKLTDDFGGHPFLMRHLCSIINKISDPNRPVRVDRALYDKAKSIFKSEYSHYIEMILNVLKQFYPDEFDMLKFIALDDHETFSQLAKISPEFTNHLLGYKIIDKNENNYSFKIEAVKDYLLTKHKYERALNNSAEMLSEISERRNVIEPKLRKIVRNTLLINLGKGTATTEFLAVLGEPRKSEHAGLAYSELFNGTSCNLYLEDLRKVIIKHYEYFKNIFGSNKDDVDSKLQVINKYRNDAHAKDLTKSEMEYFRVCITYIEKKIDDFVD